MSTLQAGQPEMEFARDVVSLRHDLADWARSQGYGFEKKDAEWPKEGSLIIRSGMFEVSIAVRRPEDLGTAGIVSGFWGLGIRYAGNKGDAISLIRGLDGWGLLRDEKIAVPPDILMGAPSDLGWPPKLWKSIDLMQFLQQRLTSYFGLREAREPGDHRN